MFGKIVASVVECSLAFAAIFIVIKAIGGTPMAQSIRSVLDGWWVCIGFGVFITIGRMLDKNFWTVYVRRGGPDDPGLARRGLRPLIQDRQMSKAEWKVKRHEERKQKRAQQLDSADSNKKK